MSKSYELFERAKKVMPGGVNSPARAYNAVGISPPFIKRGEGAYIYDEEGNKYIDFVGSWGPLILGHNNSIVKGSIIKALDSGTSFGAPTEIECFMAEFLVDKLPNIDMIRMVNSGTEATMSALRLAKAYTKREKIIKFRGNYHGHSDSLLVKAGSSSLTLSAPDSLGVSKAVAKDTLVAEYNDIKSIKEIFEKEGNNIAAVIIEPIAGNMGVIKMEEQFARTLDSLVKENNSLLIFDEVMTGFRLGFKGAQGIYDYIKPDITTYGKIIGGGLPVGAYGGRKEIMSLVSPLGGVSQAGTLSGNPLAMTAGYNTLKILYDNPSIYEKLESLSKSLEEGINNLINKYNAPIKVNRVKSMISVFFTKDEVITFEDVEKADSEMFKKYFKHMLKNGIYLPPSQFESYFLNAEMDLNDIDKFIFEMENFLKGEF